MGHFCQRGRDQYLVSGLCRVSRVLGWQRGRGRRVPREASPVQEGDFRVVATLQYLGEGVPGLAEDSVAFGGEVT